MKLQISCDLQSDMDDLQPDLTGQLDLDDDQDHENMEEQRDTQDSNIDDKQIGEIWMKKMKMSSSWMMEMKGVVLL